MSREESGHPMWGADSGESMPVDVNHRARARAVLTAILVAVFVAGGLQAASATDGDAEPAPSTSPVAAAPSIIQANRLEGAAVTADALGIDGPIDAASARVGVNAGETGTLTGHVQAIGWEDDIAGVLVSAYRLTDDESAFDHIATVVTDAGGVFAFESLPSGSYDLFFNPPADETWDWLSWGWLGSGPSPDFASQLLVEAGENALPSIHYLVAGSDIEGVVKSEARLTVLDGVPVTLWASNGPDGDGNLFFSPVLTMSTIAGEYLFDHVPDGYFLLRFDAPSASYAGEWWKNKSSFATSSILAIDGPSWLTVNANLSSRVNLGDVTVSGASATGSTLKISHRTVSGTTYKYGWFADGVVISGANKTTFVPTAAQQDKRITGRVTGSKAGVVTTTKSSEPRAMTLLTAVPTISGGTAIIGAAGATWGWTGPTLAAKAGTWTSGATLRYQWYADGVAITGATGTRYTVTPTDKYKRISVKVTGSKADHGTYSRTSAPTVRIATLGFVGVETYPSASARFHAPAMVSNGFTPGASFTYAYYADGVLFHMSPDPSVPPLNRFIGKRLQVRVTVSKAGYDTHYIYSEKSEPIVP